MDILWAYLNEIQSIATTDKEHQHRTALEILFNQIKETLNFKNIQILHEPNNDKTGLGAPDFLIKSDGLILGYIENKRVNADFNFLIEDANKNEEAQIARYLKLSPNLILTDYLQFLKVGKNEKGKIEIVQKFTICELFELQHLKKLKNVLPSKEAELLEFFKSFFALNPNPIRTAKEFANALALRTRELNNALLDFGHHKRIASLYTNFKEILYKDLLFSDFCDSFAQTLTYALFLAKLNDENNREIDLYNAKKFIPKSFPLIREMGGSLEYLEELDSIKWLINEILNIINHIDLESIIKELNQNAEKEWTNDYLDKDPYLHFYETFLSQYNPQLRELRGVYYTPFAAVHFIINAIDEVLKNELNEPNGLGAALEKDITLLDFATGTGTFLLEAFRKALENTPKNSPKYEPKNLIPKFSGFEILIAPYTVAHLKISQFFKEECQTPLNSDERLNIFLSNTLNLQSEAEEINEKSGLMTGFFELGEEFKRAQQLKSQEILIITGNPPYSGESANKGFFESEIKDTYGKEPGTKEKLKNEKNTKVLLNDYVKFMRFAESKLEKQEKGIFALISNHGFIDNSTYRGMRYHLLNTFDKIYIFNLHGNSRKQEKAPDGSKDENIFNVQQGVSISIFIKKGAKKKGELAKVFHYDLFGKRQGKYDFLLENNLKSIAWHTLKPKKPFYLFIPQNEKLMAEYNKGLSLRDIFNLSNVGVVTSNDAILVASTAEKLESQVKEFYKEFDKKFIKEISYRPFDIRKIYFDIPKIERPRIDIMQYFLDNKNTGLVFKRGFPNADCGHCFAVDVIIDYRSWSCPGMQGGDYIAPLYLDASKLPQKTLLGEQQSGMVENFTEEFRKCIDEKYQTHFSPEIILGYIYAVLYHKKYREKYIDFLKIDFPKIPFVDDKKVFLKLSELGNHLIALHLMQSVPENNAGEPLFEKENRNKTIGKVHFDGNKKRLFVNESLYFDQVEKAVWEYKIGGYQVLDKYLKSHKNEIIDFKHVEKVIKILTATLALEKEIAKINIFPR